MAAVWPGWVTLTVPSLPTVTLSASAGIVIAGCRGLPSAVTSAALCIRVKGSIARITDLSVGHKDLKESLTLDG